MRIVGELVAPLARSNPPMLQPTFKERTVLLFPFWSTHMSFLRSKNPIESPKPVVLKSTSTVSYVLGFGQRHHLP